MTIMKFRPEADVWPMMIDTELTALAEDIDKNGQHYAVSLYNGDILDGRNRYRAIVEKCQVVKTVKYETVSPASPIAFVISRNEKRRHLTDSQRGLAAAKALPFFEDEAKKRQEAGQAKGREVRKAGCGPIGPQPTTAPRATPAVPSLPAVPRPAPAPAPIPPAHRARDDAAAAFGTTPRNVQRGKVVVTDGSKKLQEAVETGRLSLGKAEQIVQTYPEKKHQDAQVAKIAASNNITRVKALTGEYEWYTPRKYLDAAVSVMGAIDLDPASSDAAQSHVKATRFFTLEHDGLQQKWSGRVFLNPPYAMPYIKQFAERMVAAVSAGEIQQAVMLTNNATDTEWFHALLAACQACCLTRGRISFLEAHDGELIEKGSPTHGQAFFYFGKAPVKFSKIFAEFGTIVTRL